MTIDLFVQKVLRMEKKRLHLEFDERAFKIVRKGLKEVWKDLEKQESCLRFVKKFLQGKKREVWESLLKKEGYKKELRWLFEASCYEEMSKEAKDWWSIYIQDHPFSSIFAHRLRELQKKKNLSWQKAVKVFLNDV